MDNFITREENDFKNIFNRFRKRDFSGNMGLMIKNSAYQFGIALAGKFLALIFTIILARILMPELFGLYNLVIGTIFLMISFTDPGISSAIIKFISPNLEKKKKAARFLKYLFKLKIILILSVSLFLIFTSKFIAQNYYEKPIFSALLFGPLIIILYGMTNFLEYRFRAANNLKPVFFKEIFFQISRFVFVLGVFFLLVDSAMTQEKKLFILAFGISIAYLATLVFMFLFSKKEISFKSIPNNKISEEEKKQINRFMLPLVITILSTTLYSYIDLLILGKFVAGEYIGYYSGASSIIGSLMAFLAFSIVMYPIFSKLDKKKLELGLKKSSRLIFLISFFASAGVFIFAPLIIKIILGNNYLSSVIVLKVFSPLIMIMSLEGIYISYFTSMGKTKFLANLSIVTTILNVVLAFSLVTFLLKFGSIYAVIGATTATLISKTVSVLGMVFYRKKINSSSSALQ